MADELFDSAFLARLEVLRVAARGLFEGTAAGSRPSRRTGPGLEFAEHRAYAPGDDYRYVDWAAYGRFERLLVRLCRREEDLAVYLLLDASASMATGHPPKFDHARRLAAALAYVALANLESVRLAAVDEGVRATTEAGRGRARLVGVLDFLRGLAPAGHTDLARAVRAFLPHAPRRGLAVLVSDLLDEAGYARPLVALKGRGFDVWCVHVTDEADASPDAVGEVAVTDAETGEALRVHLGPEVRARLRTEARAYADEVRAWCHEHGVGYAEAPTAVPVDAMVLGVLRRGGLFR